MLVLSRRVGESVVIGEDIVVTVLEVRGDVVRVGVDAPRHVKVSRQELLVEVAETNRAAASPRPDAVSGLSDLVGREPRDRRREDDTGNSNGDGDGPGPAD